MIFITRCTSEILLSLSKIETFPQWQYRTFGLPANVAIKAQNIIKMTPVRKEDKKGAEWLLNNPQTGCHTQIQTAADIKLLLQNFVCIFFVCVKLFYFGGFLWFYDWIRAQADSKARARSSGKNFLTFRNHLPLSDPTTNQTKRERGQKLKFSFDAAEG